MTARTLHLEKTGCEGGCIGFSSEPSCEVASYSNCPDTFIPIGRKQKRRFSFDFSRASCEKSCEGFYQKIRTTMVERKNPPDCPPSGGWIRITDESMCRDTGKFSFSIDANDHRLVPGERFLITAWARLPDTSELPISAYISINV